MFKVAPLLLLAFAITWAASPSPSANAMFKSFKQKKDRKSTDEHHPHAQASKVGKKEVQNFINYGSFRTFGHLFFTDAQILETAPQELRAYLEVLRTELLECGVRNGYLPCEKTDFFLSDPPVRFQLSDEDTVVMLSHVTHVKLPHLAVVGEVSFNNDGEPHLNSVTVSTFDAKINPFNLGKREFNRSQVHPVMTLSMDRDPIVHTQRILENRPSEQALYFAAEYLLSLQNNPHKEFVDSAVEKRLGELSFQAEALYAEKLLKLLRSSKLGPGAIQTLGLALINSEHPLTAQWGAICLASTGISSELVKAKLKDALAATSWEVRQNAVIGLANLHSDVSSDIGDDELLLSRFEDSDGDVFKAVMEGMKKVVFTNAHLRVLKERLGSKDWQKRRTVLGWINTIPTHEATEALFLGLFDPDKDVREDADKYLTTREFQGNQLTALLLGVTSSRPENKRLVAKYLGKIPNPGVVAPLIDLSKDSDWQVRQIAVQSLGVVPGDAAVNALIPRSADSDSDVVKSAQAALVDKTFGPAQLGALIDLSHHKEIKTRRYAIQAISKLGTAPATQALIKKLADLNEDVRNTAVDVLISREFGQEEVALLKSLENDKTYTEGLKALKLIRRY